MKASVFYKISAILLVLFAAGHTMGFRQTDPAWGVDTLIAMMKSMHFDAQGFSRSYWDFYVGFGLFVSILLVFAGLVAWQLGTLSDETLLTMPLLRWSLPVCFAIETLLNCKYFFIAPIAISIVITVFLTLAAWLPVRSRAAASHPAKKPVLGASGSKAS